MQKGKVVNARQGEVIVMNCMKGYLTMKFQAAGVVLKVNLLRIYVTLRVCPGFVVLNSTFC